MFFSVEAFKQPHQRHHQWDFLKWEIYNITRVTIAYTTTIIIVITATAATTIKLILFFNVLTFAFQLHS